MKNKKFSNLFLIPIFVFLFLFLFLASNISNASYGLEQTANYSKKTKTAFSVLSVGSDSGKFLSSRAGILIGAILSFIGIIFMILIIYGGILWMTATGNEQQVTKAKGLIFQAVIGLIIVLSAYAITAFIGRQLTDSNPALSPLEQSAN